MQNNPNSGRPGAGGETDHEESAASQPGRRDNPAGGRASDEPVYVISVAAKLAGLPAWTLRVLDEQGIVAPKRTDKNRRLYSDKDIVTLARVRTLTEIDGVNMNGVRLILRLEQERDARS